ncbi:PPK2 family polyphosphate kinase [uncultured Amnibacterium sp.]|uniref:PPK2 family polyphosphate kinase n=1 Tax=uncultured Amnibacterium sp. TaxID=1631851 RepID=UPI0035CB9704
MNGPQPVHGAVHLADIDPRSTPGIAGKKAAARESDEQAAELSDLQERLYAESKQGGIRSVLLVLQAMDTAGKGGIVRHVVGRLDPQGVHLHAFKAPTEEERSHDFLWRIRRQLPDAGMVGVFDRSHYEDVLIARVRALAPPPVIEQRYEAIAAFERELAERGTTVLKVMLHLSAEEQRERLQRRLDRVDKQWKYDPKDVDERSRWAEYMTAYEIALTRTSTREAPWFIVPADHTWYARWAVQRILLDGLRRLDPQWPRVNFDVVAERARLAAT